MEAVDWQLLSKSVEHFKKTGFSYIETNWLQPIDVLNITAPTDESIIKTDYKATGLIGSAEQAFLGECLNSGLTPGKYVSCSPCFRNEPVVDKLHQTQFMKVELFQTNSVSKIELARMLLVCWNWFNDLSVIKPTIVETETGFDIELNGIEIGSYGIRKHKDLEWIYGTGIALPRFSTALTH